MPSARPVLVSLALLLVLASAASGHPFQNEGTLDLGLTDEEAGCPQAFAMRAEVPPAGQTVTALPNATWVSSPAETTLDVEPVLATVDLELVLLAPLQRITVHVGVVGPGCEFTSEGSTTVAPSGPGTGEPASVDVQLEEHALEPGDRVGLLVESSSVVEGLPGAVSIDTGGSDVHHGGIPEAAFT